MIPSGETFIAGLRFFARRHRLPATYDEPSVRDALSEAARLSASEHDEPAALFFACARRSRAFGGTAGRLLPFIVRSHAAHVGLDLRLDDLELEILRARVLLAAIEYAEIRARFRSTAAPARRS